MANFEEQNEKVWDNIPHPNEDEFKDKDGQPLVGLICYKDEYLEVLANKRRYQQENERLRYHYENKLNLERQAGKTAFYAGGFIGMLSAIYYFKRIKPGLELLKERKKKQQEALEEAEQQAKEFHESAEAAKNIAEEAKKQASK